MRIYMEKKKEFSNDGYKPTKVERGYKPSPVPIKGTVTNGYHPAKSEGGNINKPPKKP